MANDFDSVAKIIDYWRFENNLTAGKAGNDLTAAVGGVGYESGSPLEGSYSLDLEYDSDQYAFRTDADLSAGFPLKSGDIKKLLSIACWIKPESSASWLAIWTKCRYLTVSNADSTYLASNNGVLTVGWGTATGFTNQSTGISITNGITYHVAVVIDGINKTLYVRVYNANTTIVSTYNTTFASVLVACARDFRVGAWADKDTSYQWDGLIDELVVADELLTVDEIDAIRQGTFNAANPAEMVCASTMDYVGIAGDYIYQPFIIF